MEISFENVEQPSSTTAKRASSTTIPQNLPSLTYSTLTLKKSSSATNTMETGGLCGGGNGNGNGNNPSQPQSIHHSNIILLRGARAENGQIILQNRQDLLSLLNEDSNNSIVIQQAKLKTGQTTASAAGSTTTTNLPTVKTVIADDGMSGIGQGATILLQTPIQESWNAKLKKSAGCQMSSTATTTTTSVPFLLQTIKRLDNKSQSILVFRNSSTAAPISSSNKSTTTTSSKVGFS